MRRPRRGRPRGRAGVSANKPTTDPAEGETVPGERSIKPQVTGRQSLPKFLNSNR